MNRIRNHKNFKSFLFFMALYLLNISIDCPDFDSELLKKVEVYNEQESIIELVLEQVLNLGDIIQESDLEESEDSSPRKSKNKMDTYTSIQLNKVQENITHISTRSKGSEKIGVLHRFSNQFLLQPDTPPPWA